MEMHRNGGKKGMNYPGVFGHGGLCGLRFLFV